ncbi:MAG: peptidoglycan DD-metalloendopeptidase family protein [Oscillospiraceae bacterium]
MKIKIIKIIATFMIGSLLVTVSIFAENELNLTKMHSLESEVAQAKREVIDLESSIENSDKREKEINDKLYDAKVKTAEQYERFKARVKVDCEYGDVSYLEMLLTANNFSEFVDTVVVAREIAEHDKKVFDDMESQKNEIAASMKEIEEFRANMKNNDEWLKQKNMELKRKKNEKLEFEKSLKNDEKAYKNFLEDKQSAMESFKKRLQRTINKKDNGDVKLSSPVSDLNIMREFSISDDTMKNHSGVDLKLASEDGVMAAADGKVVFVGEDDGYGNCIVIDHGFGQTIYGHLTDFGVEEGQEVSSGYKIGIPGLTGNEDEAYVHFEIIVNGKTVSPNGYI